MHKARWRTICGEIGAIIDTTKWPYMSMYDLAVIKCSELFLLNLFYSISSCALSSAFCNVKNCIKKSHCTYLLRYPKRL